MLQGDSRRSDREVTYLMIGLEKFLPGLVKNESDEPEIDPNWPRDKDGNPLDVPQRVITRSNRLGRKYERNQLKKMNRRRRRANMKRRFAEVTAREQDRILNGHAANPHIQANVLQAAEFKAKAAGLEPGDEDWPVALPIVVEAHPELVD